MAIKTNGTLWAWGYNNYGQLGDGTNISKNNPIQIGTDTKWIFVSCGSECTIALNSITSSISISTTSILEVTDNSAVAGGNIFSDGGFPITARGVCWSINQNPTIENTKTNDGTGIGSYTSTIIGLNPNTNYFVRAYATNSLGTVYGDQISFQTEKSVNVQQEIMGRNKFNVYPNPVSNILNIYTNETDFPIYLRITDLRGNTLIEEVLNDNNCSLNVSNLYSGIYLISINGNQGTFLKQ